MSKKDNKSWYDSQTETAEATAGCALEGLLQGLASVAKETSEELGPGASQEQLVSRAVKVNVFNSMNFLLKFFWLRILLLVIGQYR